MAERSFASPSTASSSSRSPRVHSTASQPQPLFGQEREKTHNPDQDQDLLVDQSFQPPLHLPLAELPAACTLQKHSQPCHPPHHHSRSSSVHPPQRSTSLYLPHSPSSLSLSSSTTTIIPTLAASLGPTTLTPAALASVSLLTAEDHSSTSSSSLLSTAESCPVRVTRSSARQAATNVASSGSATTPGFGGPADPVPQTPSTNTNTTRINSARKRKNTNSETSPRQEAISDTSPSSSRRSKRPRVNQPSPPNPAQAQPSTSSTSPTSRQKKGKAPAVMSSSETPLGSRHPPESSASGSRSSRHKKPAPDLPDRTASGSASTRRSKRGGNHTNNTSTNYNTGSGTHDPDTVMTGTEDHNIDTIPPPPPPPPPPADDPPEESEENEDDEPHRYDEGDEDDLFSGFGASGSPSHVHSSTLRALTGMLSGLTTRLRQVLLNLHRKDDPSIQLIALQELSEILLVSNEDNLAGHFSPDSFVRELVSLMQPNELTGEENPEIMLLACRCLANLMEALPASAANIVYGGAVPVLCQKLLEISFIDLAEQALSTLEKISVEYPTSIVREGGLTACLSYLDFFASSTQRTAVTTAANCCRNIPSDSFSVVRDVIPILLGVLGSSDQRVVEQAALCVSRIVESFKYHPTKLEELVSVDLLRAILRLLLPGSTNLIGPHIHTQFLRVLAHTARASPRLAAELVQMNVVETLYQILTGVSPPPADEKDIASKLGSVLTMQALLHRPRDQILETLNVVCELLPNLPRSSSSVPSSWGDMDPAMDQASNFAMGPRARSSDDKRLELLEGCKEQVRRFTLILFPTLTDAYSSTVNLTVRQKVLTAQIKMLSNFDPRILTEALKAVPYASFLASILSQQDHLSLVVLALKVAELLMNRLDQVYRYQLYREGVISEIAKLAIREPDIEGPQPGSPPSPQADGHSTALGELTEAAAPRLESDNERSDDDDGNDHDDDEDSDTSSDADGDGEVEEDEDEDDEIAAADDEDDREHDDHEMENEGPHHEDMSASPVSSRGSTMSLDAPPRPPLPDFRSMRTRIAEGARMFIETYETEKHAKAMKKKANKILYDLSSLANDIETFYLRRTVGTSSPDRGKELFRRLASYFDADVLESITSAEFLASGLVRALEQVFSNSDQGFASSAQQAFLQAIMGCSVRSRPKMATADSPATPFSVMIQKLQDLLSRSEHFEVITVHHNTFDGNRSSAASMLAKTIRLKLVADDDSDIPRPYRNIMVSIHAIATLKSLDDYLRPRLSMSERTRGARRQEQGSLSRALAIMAGSPGSPLTAAARLAERSRASSSSQGPQASSAASSAAQPHPPSSSRSSRKSKAKTQYTPPVDSPTSPENSSAVRGKSGRRRSSNRPTAALSPAIQQGHVPPAPLPMPIDDADVLGQAIECVDTRHLSDDDDEMAETSDLSLVRAALDAESMGEAPPSDPGAVNLEFVHGGRITARNDDGTRVQALAQTPAPHRSTPHVTGRPSSLAAAFQRYGITLPPERESTTTDDWHIEFSLDGELIPLETTIYRAVHSSNPSPDDHFSRGVWSQVHPIKFRRVPGPAAAESIAFASTFDATGDKTESNGLGVPASLANHPTTASILRLLKMLHDLNANIDDVLLENQEAVKPHVEPMSQFVNTKLTAKLNRQLEEPLIVASNCLPSWSEDLARLYPFLFPFETRHLFLQSTSFGYARSMTRWQNAQSQEESRRDRRDERPFLGKLQRQKVRISRSKILESAVKVMELYGVSQSILEVEYFEEVGTGLGPTLEFYATVSQEFAKKKLKLWRDHDPHEMDEFVSAPNGLFPRPLSDEQAAGEEGEKILQLFKVLGKFIARSMIDSRIIDINLNPIFFRIGDELSGVRPSLGAIHAVDPAIGRSLAWVKKFAQAKKEIEEDSQLSAANKVTAIQNIIIKGARIDDGYLNFTLPGYPEIELVPNGSHIMVTIENVEHYLARVTDMTLGGGVQRQVDAFRTGFSQVFPYSALSSFKPDELVSLFGRTEEDWSLETLTDSIKADHGYNMDSKSVKNLLQTMSELRPLERREFLQFTTGSPKLPIGGFKSLTPMFTVVCKPSEAPFTSDDYLPSVMTCVNYLKLPDYSDISIMRKQLFTAIKEGQGAFHLS